ncbi:hypothetical protein LP420_08415 [Massilia sp. B-10]|nr:hypothetical protein LP420_08415 [Massilia sp. B-10]
MAAAQYRHGPLGARVRARAAARHGRLHRPDEHARQACDDVHHGLSIIALIVTLLLAPFLSAMAAMAARAPGTPGWRELVADGLADYPRMLRMLVWSVVPLGLAAALGSAAIDAASEHGLSAITAADASLWSTLAMVLTGVLLALAQASLDAGRAQLAIERRRSSAVKAWWAELPHAGAPPAARAGRLSADRHTGPGSGLAHWRWRGSMCRAPAWAASSRPCCWCS